MFPTTSSGPARRLRAGTTRRLEGAAGLAAALALGAALSGCSAFGGSGGASTYTGAAVPAGAPRAGQAAGGSTASGAPSASGASGAAAQASQKPYVAAVAKGACSPQKFVQSAALVSGAISTYITKPLASGSASARATARAASAAGYAAKQLGAGVKAVESCPTAKALTGVSKQNVTALQRLSSALRAGTIDPQKVSAVGALFGDVTSQASRLKLTITPKAPAVSDLAG